MRLSKRPQFNTLRAAFAAFRAGGVSILIFEGFYSVLTSLIVKPLMSFVMQVLLRASGNELAFNGAIWQFALTVPGLLCIVLLAGIAVLSVFFEFAVVISIAKRAIEKKDVGIKAGVVRGLWSFGSLKGVGALLFAIYALLLLPLMDIGVTSSLLPRLTIPNFITGELEKTVAGALLLLGGGILAILLFLCLLFVLPAMVLEHVRFAPAVRRSAKTLRAHPGKVLGLTIILFCLWIALFLGSRLIFDFFFGIPNVTLAEAIAYYGFSLRTLFMLLVWLVAKFLQLLLMPLSLILLTTYYLPSAIVVEPEAAVWNKIRARLEGFAGWLQAIVLKVRRFLESIYRKIMAVPFIQKHRRMLAVVLGLIVLWGIATSLMTGIGIHDPIVVGHRGSAEGVENTLPAIQHAIDAGADYAEIDVLLSADGVPMVIHDTNLERLSGRNVNVYELTAEELQQIQLFQNGYTGQISTLEEVVAFCEGKILLAVEYKLHGHEQVDLVKEVMRVMEQSAYQKDSLYLSLDFALVSQMKTQYPGYLTGYCVYGNVGRLTGRSLRDLNLDFLLVEEWMVSWQLLKACREAWLPVYVWTVNDAETMEDFLQMGVVGLVTDYPNAAVEVLGSMYNLAQRMKPYEVE